MNLQLCLDAHANFLGFFDTSIAPPLLFYSYIPVVVVSIFFGIFILVKDKFSLLSKLVFALSMAFVLWVINIIFQWIAIYANVVHFGWQLTALFEVLVPIFAFYLVHVYVNKKDLSFREKILFASLFSFVLILLPTRLNMLGFDMVYCEAIIGPLLYYVYGFELLVSLAILGIGLRKFFSSEKKDDRLSSLFLTIGVSVFLTIFSLSNIFGEVMQTYEINLVGPVGMVVFLALLSYLIIRFKAFDVKLLSIQVLLISLGVLTGAVLFIDSIEIAHIVVAATLMLFFVLGLITVKGVKKEIKQREEIERLALDLRKTNDNLEHANVRLKELDRQKTEFVSFATHQLRSPLTAMKGYSSLLLEGDYGEINMEARGAIEKIHESTNTLTTVVNDYLNISRIELGTMKYDFVSTDVKDLIKKIIGELQPNIDKAGLKLSFVCDARMKYMAKVDLDKFAQVVANMIDNAIKYTPQGSITLSLTKDTTKNTVLIASKDTGIGMAAEVIPKLFAKFSRAENASKVNIRGTGLGLFVAKQIAEAHKGRMWAESEGEGKGSQFYVEIPGEK